MPFIAECPYCKHGKVKAPDHAIGWTAECPNPDCGSSFTLVPGAEPRAAAPAPPPVPASGAPPPAPVNVVQRIQATAKTPPPETRTPKVVRRVIPQAPPQREASSQRQKVNVCTLSAFVVGSVALLFASLQVDSLSLVLGGIGLVIGLVALVQALGQERGILWASLSSVLSLTTVLVVAFWPSLLNPKRLLVEAAPEALPERVVEPIDGNTGAGPVDAAAEWADASRGALRVRDVWVRIESARVEHVELRIAGQKQYTAQKFLVLKVQVANVGAERRLDYESWADGSAGSSKHPPKLVDNTARSYRQCPCPSGAAAAGQRRGGVIYPGKSLDDVLIFEAPADKIEYLRLQLPGSACKTEGLLQLEIPRSMIQFR